MIIHPVLTECAGFITVFSFTADYTPNKYPHVDSVNPEICACPNLKRRPEADGATCPFH